MYVTTRFEDRLADLQRLGLSPIVADITIRGSLEALGKTQVESPLDTIVVAVGMDRTRYDSVHSVYVDGLRNVLHVLEDSTPDSHRPHLIYVSSTGVYGDFAGAWVDEDSHTEPQREGGQACLAAEQLLQESSFADQTTILRMAGLYGGERVPTLAKIKSGNWEKLSPDGFLNLIHRDDAVAAIAAIAEKRLTGETFCVVDSHPTLRRDYYQYIADQMGLGPIQWPRQSNVDPNSRSSSSKRIRNDKLFAATGLALKHPDFRSGLAECFAGPQS